MMLVSRSQAYTLIVGKLMPPEYTGTEPVEDQPDRMALACSTRSFYSVTSLRVHQAGFFQGCLLQ